MKKTIFYIPCENGEMVDWYFSNQPYKISFVLEDFLYEPNGNIEKTIVVDKFIKNVSLTVKDEFTTEGIIRRIAMYISK